MRFRAGQLLVIATWLVAYRPRQSMASVIFGFILGTLVAIGIWLALLLVFRLELWGRGTGKFDGLQYGVIGVPLGIVWSTWRCGQLRRAKGVVSPPLILASTDVAFMTSFPLRIWLVGLFTVPGPMLDPIAVSTIFAPMLVTRSSDFLARLRQICALWSISLPHCIYRYTQLPSPGVFMLLASTFLH